MCELIEKLRNEGCNVDEALDICMGMEEFYVKMLEKLLNDKHIYELDKAIKDGDAPRTFEASHALKGIYANLGLTPLTICNTPIVETSRHGILKDVPEAYEKLRKKHDRIVGYIKEDNSKK